MTNCAVGNNQSRSRSAPSADIAPRCVSTPHISCNLPWGQQRTTRILLCSAFDLPASPESFPARSNFGTGRPTSTGNSHCRHVNATKAAPSPPLSPRRLLTVLILTGPSVPILHRQLQTHTRLGFWRDRRFRAMCHQRSFLLSQIVRARTHLHQERSQEEKDWATSESQLLGHPVASQSRGMSSPLCEF